VSGVGLTFGLKAPQQHASMADIQRIWRLADDAGFDGLWLFDHFIPMTMGERSGPIFEAWTLLAAMAQATRRVRLGTLVTGNLYRHPGVLAKMAVTVDHLSGGRLEMGIGAGGDDEADRMLGIPAAPAQLRIERLDEACQVLRTLWTDERSGFDGAHYRLADALADPKPVQRPGPPIWIGSSGERYGLRVVARHADVWLNASLRPNDPAELPRLLRLSQVLDRHCADVGRDPAEIRRAVQLFLPLDDAETTDLAAAYVDAGFTDVVFIPTAGGTPRIERLAALLPALRALS
jgi:F420-dependent oxidoreductase-like protein